ncbi:hypothetical protein [Streptomyces sp. CMB-StM0423]|uniref:hypothetical protein n=1 Tax=Streptomyces sp. CMB-StM0423 TaxID=2059884 RepID=UPI00131E0221|nr:hypothetical protein [Streptomyces sp. CMB-StM0423]
MPGAGPVRVAALLGDEAEFGEDVGEPRAVAVVAVGLLRGVEMLLGGVEPALSAGGGPEADAAARIHEVAGGIPVGSVTYGIEPMDAAAFRAA